MTAPAVPRLQRFEHERHVRLAVEVVGYVNVVARDFFERRGAYAYHMPACIARGLHFAAVARVRGGRCVKPVSIVINQEACHAQPRIESATPARYREGDFARRASFVLEARKSARETGEKLALLP